MARCMVMGIVNVTEDSFSDGGRYLDQDVAVDHARELLTQGADIIDVGGESTRPGAQRIDAATEQRRVIPVVRELAQSGVRVSVDTMRAKVAAAAVEAGAEIINFLSFFLSFFLFVLLSFFLSFFLSFWWPCRPRHAVRDGRQWPARMPHALEGRRVW